MLLITQQQICRSHVHPWPICFWIIQRAFEKFQPVSSPIDSESVKSLGIYKASQDDFDKQPGMRKIDLYMWFTFFIMESKTFQGLVPLAFPALSHSVLPSFTVLQPKSLFSPWSPPVLILFQDLCLLLLNQDRPQSFTCSTSAFLCTLVSISLDFVGKTQVENH